MAAAAVASLPGLGPFLWKTPAVRLDTGSESAVLARLGAANRSLMEFLQIRSDWNLELLEAHWNLQDFLRLALRQRLLRRAGAQFIEALETERGRIARELHDSAGQTLAAVILNLELVQGQLGAAGTEAQARLARSRELASLTLDHLRRISHEMTPPEWSQQNFAQAVEWLVETMGLRNRLAVELRAIRTPDPLPPAVKTVLYRTLQEGLTNVVRHAKAGRVVIQASVVPRGISLTLEDDGQGFDPAVVGLGRGGIGLANLRRRVESLGGRFEIRSSTGRGCCLLVTVPLGPD